jgi:gamma-glutamyltranspeptidase / glutathione hydrolase
MRAGIAAGHPATAAAGWEILEDGGSAADAAVAASLASCVAETVMTGILGGGYAIYWDAERGIARNLDFFVAAPGLGAPPVERKLVELAVPFGAELVHYSIGPASCAVPSVPAGLDALWRAYGRLPWQRLVEPALALARDGVEMPPAHASCLAMLAPVFTLDEGARIYAPEGKPLAAGDILRQPGLVNALEALSTEGGASLYRGALADSLLALMADRGGAVTRDDLEAYEARWSQPVEVEYRRRRLLSRGGLSGVPEAVARLPMLAGLSDADYVLALEATLNGDDAPGDTTNLVVVDAERNACVLTTSLGLGSGDFLPGLDLHLNSMLGEVDLLRGPLEPGMRMASMMAPTLLVDDVGLEVAIGAAGGTRLRTALLLVLSTVVERAVEPQAAVDAPRFHPTPAALNAEPGVDHEALAALERRGRIVRRWPSRHHYFGGVSVIGRTGAGADPRRSGAVRLAD